MKIRLATHALLILLLALLIGCPTRRGGGGGGGGDDDDSGPSDDDDNEDDDDAQQDDDDGANASIDGEWSLEYDLGPAFEEQGFWDCILTRNIVHLGSGGPSGCEGCDVSFEVMRDRLGTPSSVLAPGGSVDGRRLGPSAAALRSGASFIGPRGGASPTGGRSPSSLQPVARGVSGWGPSPAERGASR